MVRRCVLLALVALTVAAAAYAQFGQRGFGRGFGNVRKATVRDLDGTFLFCRVAFGRDPRGDGGSWIVDFPRADINLSIRLS